MVTLAGGTVRAIECATLIVFGLRVHGTITRGVVHHAAVRTPDVDILRISLTVSGIERVVLLSSMLSVLIGLGHLMTGFVEVGLVGVVLARRGLAPVWATAAAGTVMHIFGVLMACVVALVLAAGAAVASTMTVTTMLTAVATVIGVVIIIDPMTVTVALILAVTVLISTITSIVGVIIIINSVTVSAVITTISGATISSIIGVIVVVNSVTVSTISGSSVSSSVAATVRIVVIVDTLTAVTTTIS